MANIPQPALQTLPSNLNRSLDEPITRDWLNYWQNTLITLFQTLSRTAGGTGLNNDALDNGSVKANNIILKGKKVLSSFTTRQNFGTAPITVVQTTVTTSLNNMEVSLSANVRFASDTLGNNLIIIKIERSPATGTITWTSIDEGSDSAINATGRFFIWRNCTIQKAIDVLPVAGSYFYRVTIRHLQNDLNTGLVDTSYIDPNNLSNSNSGTPAEGQKQNYIYYEVYKSSEN